ncbi:MAG: phasin family protein [Candidatus Sericytochromatia bacterium]
MLKELNTMDLLKKASLLTAEFVSMSADKVQEVADEFVKKGTLHDSEAKKFVSEVRTNLEVREKEFTERWEQVVSSVQQIGSTLGIKKVEKDNLDERIDELERHIDELKARRDLLNKEIQKDQASGAAKPAAAANGSAKK